MCGGSDDYGLELILDLHQCDPGTFTRESIGGYFDELCGLIGMQAEDRHFWDDEGRSPEDSPAVRAEEDAYPAAPADRNALMLSVNMWW